MNNWISSKDEAPRRDIDILVALSLNDVLPIAVQWTEDDWFDEPGFTNYFESNLILEKDILYWMPLPKPPKN